jgi:hypothetical protein
MHNGKLNSIRRSPSVMRMIKLRSMGWARRRWEGTTKINFKDIGLEGVDWIRLTQVGDQS